MLYRHDASICKQLLRIVVDQLPVREKVGGLDKMAALLAEFAYIFCISHPASHPHCAHSRIHTHTHIHTHTC